MKKSLKKIANLMLGFCVANSAILKGSENMMSNGKRVFKNITVIVVGLCMVNSSGLYGSEDIPLNEVNIEDAAAPCPHIDKANIDTDGMPFCPAFNPNVSAWTVFRCAIQQANVFNGPTPTQKTNADNILSAFKTSLTAGISKNTTDQIMANADALNLQVCRTVQTRDNVRDSFLVLYTKPGVRDYSGPFMMLRETKHSKVIVVGPHDDTDDTYAVTKIATQDTYALGTISNGHIRRDTPGAPGGAHGDFVHETSQYNLGTYIIKEIGQMFPQYVYLHAHGMKNDVRVLDRSRSQVYQNVYEQAIRANTDITQFSPLNAYFTIDPLVNTEWYLKTEVPARIYANSHHVLASVVKVIEGQSWAWE